MTSVDFGTALIRIVAGLTMAAHGYSKFFRGGRLQGTASWFHSIGMRPGRMHARLAATTEILAGIALAAGVATPVAAAGFVALMLVAAATVHRGSGFYVVDNGWEYNLVLATAAVSVAIGGAGRLSFDWLIFGKNLFSGWWALSVVAVGIGAAAGLLSAFYRPNAEAFTPW